MSRFATSVGRAVVGSYKLCGARVAVPANAEPPGSPPIAEGTQKLFGLLSKGFIPDDCDAVDRVGSQRAAIICRVNREANGPISATYALYGDATSLQSGFFTAIGRDDQLVACPGTNQSPTVYRHPNSPGQVAGHISCGDINGQSEVVWTSDADLLLVAAQSLDEVPPLYQWWLADG
jgi:serine/threonine kinase PknH